MQQILTGILFLTGLALAAPAAEAFEDDQIPFCIRPPHDTVCAEVPRDQLDFDRAFVYNVLSENAQFPFDNFSWQSFVALNWPVDDTGEPLADIIGTAPTNTRNWHSLLQQDQIFKPRENVGACRDDDTYPVLKTGAFHQASGEVLIDRYLNYVVYDTRINQVAADYIRNRNLMSKKGQSINATSSIPISFPLGTYEDDENLSGGTQGALIIKTSWRVLLPEHVDESSKRYFTMPGHIELAASDSADNTARCLSVHLAMVGMHINHRTQSGNGDRWIWSTFEHVDGAPLATNARDPNSIYEQPLFADGCTGPDSVDRDFVFYDPDCPDCASNHIKTQDWRWAMSPPYAAAYGSFGTQVVRCWDLFEHTERLNNLWHRKLDDVAPGSIWQNYFLISTQWKGNYGGGIFGDGEVPRFLTNSTLETYGQYDENGTCIGCHAEARTTADQDANFSFLLRLAN